MEQPPVRRERIPGGDIKAEHLESSDTEDTKAGKVAHGRLNKMELSGNDKGEGMVLNTQELRGGNQTRVKDIRAEKTIIRRNRGRKSRAK